MAARAGIVTYPYLVVYPYRRPTHRTDSWAVATGDRPEDVKHRSNSKDAAITWARKRSGNVQIAGENPIGPPTSTAGQIGAGVGLLAATTGVGAVIGAAAAPPCASDTPFFCGPVFGAMGGAGLGILGGGVLGLGLLFSPTWRTAGASAALGAAALIGIGAIRQAMSHPPGVLPATPGVVPTTTSVAGTPLVTLAPGNMGVLKTQSGPNGPGLDIGAPSGTIQNLASSNPNVIASLVGATGSQTIMTGGALLPGTTTLTIAWTDRSGTPQQTTFQVVAS